MIRHAPISTLFPYTTLFRSVATLDVQDADCNPWLWIHRGGQRHAADASQLDRRSAHQANVVRSSRSEEHTSELQSPCNLVCRLLLEKKKKNTKDKTEKLHML